MNVLSLFDGISCGMVALERAGIPVERYVAYEIEEDAIKISEKNYPMIEHNGDVFNADFTKYQGFDLLIGGSPCTHWSIARSRWNDRETTASGIGWELFSQYVRALREAKPRYFLYENNFSMSKEIKEQITKELGVEPIYINSNLVSAQDRKRLYWTNIPDVTIPEDKGILFSDILEENIQFRELKPFMFGTWGGQRRIDKCSTINRKKAFTVTTSKTHPSQYYLNEDKTMMRNLTITEFERLQTLPDNYTSGVKESSRYKGVGNGWTVDVIVHIFTGIKKEKESKNEMELKMDEFQLPEKILFNYEELKQELTEKVSMYESMVYTDNQIKDAKSDRANLNKLKKALNDERIRMEKEYMVPFNEFKTKINEIISIIDKPVAVIDKQVKEYEEIQKQKKQDEIVEYFNSTEHPNWLHVSQIMDEKWMNASVSMKSIKDAIDARLDQIEIDLTTLHDLPEFGFEATEVYKTTLDMNKAIYEAKRMSEIAKAKAEAEQEKQMNPPVEELEPKTIENGSKTEEVQEIEPVKTTNEIKKQWISFAALLSTEDALALKHFFNNRKIEFKAI